MKRRQEGFTLIESMVAFVMLVGGLLGVFQLHLTAKRGNHEAFEYTQAHALASAIVARMRLNTRQLSTYVASNYGSGTMNPPLTSCVSPPTGRAPLQSSRDGTVGPIRLGPNGGRPQRKTRRSEYWRTRRSNRLYYAH
jgi:Tfp pilus assembly protein PilV